jgi:DNA-repair protein complementing XP-A cells
MAAEEKRKRGQDSHGGFFFEEEDKDKDAGHEDKRARPRQDLLPPLVLGASSHNRCTECKEEFYEALLLKQFGIFVCDNCRRKNEDGKYSLVTKSEAKEEYLLNDVDLDTQYGGLRCIEKKNPHNERWGLMKLYLRYQVQELSFGRYGGVEGLEKEIQERFKKRNQLVEKRQKAKVMKMRKETLSSTWKKPSQDHVHKYGPEEPSTDGADGMWQQTCTDCGFVTTFEKL